MITEKGIIIDGKYEILKQIGKGGMSVVYLAMDNRLNKQWAIKEIKRAANGINNEIIVSSLLAEANLMKRLDHPALPRIVDIIDDAEKLYVVMDYVEGESLDRLLISGGAQPQEAVIEWAKQLCDALRYLHNQKPPIIYRDMKPSNIMLKPDGNLKLIDFGIAREYKENNSADTTILGTRGYAPPEQHGARQTDERADIYALGMTIHQLLTGADPRAADYEYFSVRKWVPDISAGLDKIIDKCTSIDPDRRYQSCDELLYALEHYEEEEEGYKKKQKRKLIAFGICAAVSLIGLIIGFAGKYLVYYENSRDYNTKINISTSTPYETKIQTYLEAIDLFVSDSRAYIMLLNAYQDNNLFGDTESNQFTGKFNENKALFDTGSEEYLNLMYEAGITYFYLYSGGDNSSRSRILKSYPYFEAIALGENTDFSYYDISFSYYIIGSFYSRYIVDATSIKEPDYEAYDELIASLILCIESMQSYDYDDGAYIKLTLYEEILNLINSHRQGLAGVGIDEGDIMTLIDGIYEAVYGISVTQEKSIGVREQIINNYEEYTENIERAYINAAKGG